MPWAAIIPVDRPAVLLNSRFSHADRRSARFSSSETRSRGSTANIARYKSVYGLHYVYPESFLHSRVSIFCFTSHRRSGVCVLILDIKSDCEREECFCCSSFTIILLQVYDKIIKRLSFNGMTKLILIAGKNSDSAGTRNIHLNGWIRREPLWDSHVSLSFASKWCDIAEQYPACPVFSNSEIHQFPNVCNLWSCPRYIHRSLSQSDAKGQFTRYFFCQ